MKLLTVSVITLALAIPAVGQADAKCEHKAKTSQEQLLTDLEKAVHEACGATDIRTAGSLVQAMNSRECVEEKMALATKMLESRQVSAVSHEEPLPVPTGR